VTQEQMRSFLLGTMPEPARLEIEEAFFENDETYDQLQESLNDLLDDYARGDLPEEERQRVEERLLDLPGNRVKLKLAQAFAQRARIPSEKPRHVIPLWVRALASTAAIAAIAWLGFDDFQIRRALHTRQPLETPLGAPQFATIRLSQRLVRGPAAVPQITLPAGRNFVRIELSTEETYPGYAVEIDAADRGRIWMQTALSRAGGMVGLWLPASLIAPGNYEFLLYGTGAGTGGAGRELLGSYPCRVLAESPMNTKPAQ